ncbi:electron transfer flavoprotein subunit beta/FixA family protein [Allofournierella sp.]|uniref:electron transfer flavoprotein subunit beta/FixA family protein n=1 Tax=Allofournierella sp. TaxID=1940256 RepID=UPI003AB82364
MEILVCIKQVPGTSAVEVDPVTGVLRRDGVESKLNPYDLYALELAFQLRQKYGGRVRTITMGPPQAKAAVLEALYMGADGGAVISDRRFAGADVLATSYTLAQGLRSLAPFDLILCGKQTTDGDTAQVGPEIAEHLDLPHVTGAAQVLAAGEGQITVRGAQDGLIVTQTLRLPCLVCVDGAVNTPRLPSYRRKKQLGEGQVRFLSLDDMEDRDERHYGLSGSPTQVVRIFPPEKSTEKELWTGTGPELAQKLFDLFKGQKAL